MVGSNKWKKISSSVMDSPFNAGILERGSEINYY